MVNEFGGVWILATFGFVQHLIYGIRYLTNYWIFGKTSPLICGLVLHNKCNLRCRHCTIVDRPDASMSFDEVVKVIYSFYFDEHGWNGISNYATLLTATVICNPPIIEKTVEFFS